MQLLGKIFAHILISFEQNCPFDFKMEIFQFSSSINLEFFKFRAYDRAAIKFRGLDADINFNLVDYEDDLKQVKKMHQFFVTINLDGSCNWFFTVFFMLDR